MPVLRSEGKPIGDVRNFEHREQIRHTLVDVVRMPVPLATIHRKRHIFRHGKRIEERARLKHHRHAPANFRELLFGPVGDVLARHDDSPRVGMQKSKQQFQRHRFPHAAAAHDHRGFALIDEKAHVVQHVVIAERFVYIAKFEIVIWTHLPLSHRCSCKASSQRPRSCPRGAGRTWRPVGTIISSNNC